MQDDAFLDPTITPSLPVDGDTCVLPEEINIQIVSEAPAEDRYTRLDQLGWNRNWLRNAYAMVVGAGALGNEVLKNLALLGWGHILVVDMDTIADSNLARSVLFRQSDADAQRHKAVVAAERVREINPDVEVLPVIAPIPQGVGLGAYRRMDVVFGCLDNRQARLEVSKACWQTRTPYVDGGLDGINGDVHVFLSPYTACYGCTLSAAARQAAAHRHPCLRLKLNEVEVVIPTAPTISAIIAGWQTQLGVKLLHGRSVPLGKRLAFFGGSDLVEQYAIDPNPTCGDHAAESILCQEEVMRLPFGAQDGTLRQLVEYARNTLGLGPDTIIQFDFDILTTAHCPNGCGSQDFYRRQDAVWLKELVCPQCKSLLSIEPPQYRFDGTEPYADRLLAELGVPPLHIVTAVNYPQRIYQPLELAGDWRTFFPDMVNLLPQMMPIYLAANGSDPAPVLAPKRIPLRIWTASYRPETASVPVENGRAFNVTRHSVYELDKSLLELGAEAGDLLTIDWW